MSLALGDLALCVLTVFGQAERAEAEFSPEALARILELSPLPPPQPDPTNAWADDEAAARLGQALFYDTGFSGAGDVSCATCHRPELHFADGRRLARAVGEFPRHTPALWNVAYNRWFSWDGRKDSLWSHALGPLEDPREHAGSRLQYLHRIADDPALRRAYVEVFGALPDVSDTTRFPKQGRPIPGDPDHPHAVAWYGMPAVDRHQVNVVFANLGKALAAFQRRILSRRAPFDVFVEGLREENPTKRAALDPAARRGLGLFVGRARCHLCHNGPNLTDLEFHNDRVPPPGGLPPEGAVATDPGRYRGVGLVKEDPFNGLGLYSDSTQGEAHAKLAFLFRNIHNLREFKTPSLRNVAVTAPYMHAGNFATLEEVLHFYSTFEDALPVHKGSEKLLVPLNLSATEKTDLVAFLESLTDTELSPDLLGPPATPYLP